MEWTSLLIRERANIYSVYDGLVNPYIMSTFRPY